MPSDLQVDNIKDGSATKTLATLSSTAVTLHSDVTFPAGHIVQVKSTIVTARSSSTDTNTAGTGTDIGLNVTLTIKTTNPHFYIIVSAGLGTVTSSNGWGMILSRDGTKILNGADDSNRNGIFIRSVDHAGNTGTDVNHGIGAMNHGVDKSGGTKGASTTFKAGLITEAGTAYINRTEANSDVTLMYGSNTSTSITVMEIAQ